MQRRHKNCKIQEGTGEEVISLIIKSVKIRRKATTSWIIHNVHIRKMVPVGNKSVAKRPVGSEVIAIHQSKRANVCRGQVNDFYTHKTGKCTEIARTD